MMLVCKEISKRYSDKIVLIDATFELEKGSIYTLLGRNGSGKSTLMKIIAGLVKTDHGEVILQGKNIGVQTKAYIAYMPTEMYFYDYMKVEDLRQYYEDFYPDFHRDRFYELINRLELSTRDKVKKLSSGEMVKLKLAITLARNAKLYLLDEPLNGIDLITRDLITTILLETASEDNTIVISSHFVEEIENIVDHVIFLDKGNVCLIGDAEEIRENRGKSIVDLYRELLA